MDVVSVLKDNMSNFPIVIGVLVGLYFLFGVAQGKMMKAVLVFIAVEAIAFLTLSLLAREWCMEHPVRAAAFGAAIAAVVSGGWFVFNRASANAKGRDGI